MTQADVVSPQAALLAESENIWTEPVQRATNAFFEGRTSNMAQFKPGVQAIILMFSNQKATQVFRFPWYDRLKPLVEPIVRQARATQVLILHQQIAWSLQIHYKM